MCGCRSCAPGEIPCSKNDDKGTTDTYTKASAEDEKKALKGVISRELRAGILYTGCDCIKRNGLQDDCQRSQCLGSPACLNPTGPTCKPAQLALKRIREAPSPAMKRDIDPFKPKCDDKPGSKPGDNKMASATGAAHEGSRSCAACGKPLKSNEKGNTCEHCLKMAGQTLTIKNEHGKVLYTCTPVNS